MYELVGIQYEANDKIMDGYNFFLFFFSPRGEIPCDHHFKTNKERA